MDSLPRSPSLAKNSDSGTADQTIDYEMGCWIDCDWLVVRFDGAWHLTGTYQFQD